MLERKRPAASVVAWPSVRPKAGRPRAGPTRPAGRASAGGARPAAAASDAAFGKSRVFHLCDFLIRTLERDALPLYEKLTKRFYAAELKGSETFVARIANVFYGVPEPQTGGGSFMQKMMQMMG